MQGLRIIKLLVLAQIFICGCYYDVEEELYPTTECQTDDMSLASDIIPILTQDCMQCHSNAANFGNVSLEDYEDLLQYVEDGSLLGVVKHDSGFSPMPKGAAKLLDCEIEKIQAWINNGALNN